MAARLAHAVAAGAASVLPGFLVGALALQIRSDLDVRVEAVAAGVTVFFVAGALGAGWGGRLADHIGALRAIRRCVLVTAASLAAMALAPSLVVLFALLAVAGVANSVTQPAINLFVAEQIPTDRQGLGFGIKQSGIPAAILVSGLALPVLALPLGWRATLALCALVPLATGLALPRRGPAHVSRRAASRRPSRALLLTALGAALGTAGPSALGAYLVASAVHVGIDEGAAGLLAALASGLSLATRVSLGARADRRRDYGLAVVVVLLAAGSVGFALMASDTAAVFVFGALVAFTLGWGWPGLFNLAVVDSNRETPGSATGVSQTGIYVGAAGGPAAFGALAAGAGYGTAWVAVAVTTLLSACVLWVAGRATAEIRAGSGV
ncbi:MAG TPA: MFS transporter [Thermoleophilaceae bacterium]|nr:MFS transporter [Thermoleophilaceae bacterium]